MKLQQNICADVLPFSLERFNDRRPGRRGNAAASTPLNDHPMTLPDVIGHLSERVPAVEYVLQGLHCPHSVGDGLSRQGGAGIPVRESGIAVNNLRMGRAPSPVQFNKELALRLRSARIAAGYENMREFAQLAGIEYERYKKWESGRTPIQHEYMRRIWELTGKDANYFYGISPAEQQQVRRAAP